MPELREKRRSRDNFDEGVKERLAAEVGYRCSIPDCGAPTIGPSATEPKGFSNSGVAAHITAAAPDGPRYDASLTSSERSGHDNGIHCCAKHSRIVDNDPVAYTVAQLRAWKTEAIDLQRRAHSTGDIDPNGRIKLARTSRHDIASRAMKASLRCRAAVMTGFVIADQARKPRRPSLVTTSSLNARIGKWTQEITRAHEEAEDAIMDIRVHWGIKSGEPPGLQSLIELLGCLEDWRRHFIDSFQRVAQRLASTTGVGITPPQRVRSASKEPWDWTGVFDGVEEQRQRLQEAIDGHAHDVEAWAETFIVSREGLISR